MSRQFNVRPHGNGHLPTHRGGSLSAFINKDKLTGPGQAQEHRRWMTTYYLPVPGAPTRRLRVILPIPPFLGAMIRKRFTRPKAVAAALFIAVLVVINLTIVSRKLHEARRPGDTWQETAVKTITKTDTCVFSLHQIRNFYEWEIWSGNQPSRRRIPARVGIPHSLYNPALPPPENFPPIPKNAPPYVVEGIDNATIPLGPHRTYFIREIPPRNQAYPPRPEPGVAADFDKIFQYCDFSTEQYVRDCLEFMRVGGGLDNGKRMRRGNPEPYSYLFRETAPTETHPLKAAMDSQGHPVGKIQWTRDESSTDTSLRETGSESVDVNTRPVMHANVITPSNTSDVDLCDPERPRIFHMYWSGPFTDKPYLTLVSYLYTQALDLHIPIGGHRPTNTTGPCRPVFWVWVNPGVQASVPNPNAKRQLFDTLAANPWSAPFLHPRFHDVIKFKLWNTTEQLDFHPELSEWREHNVLGKLQVEPDEALKLEEANNLVAKYKEAEDARDADGAPSHDKDYQAAMAAMAELKASDAAQVIMSDLARFLVTHRYGGMYLDVDNIFLRDFEELWNWRGAFAMRWSIHLVYNTAILRMHQNSALGSFLMRAAMRSSNHEPFHPQSITNYLTDAGMTSLLFRLPDALFDPNFLNTEGRQRDRPPYPAYSWDSSFEEFFNTPVRSGEEPEVVGFDGFYRGAYSYHWHNQWQKPLDNGRNFPDLGQRFAHGELLARQRLAAAARAAARKAAQAAAAAAAAAASGSGSGAGAQPSVESVPEPLVLEESFLTDGDITTDPRDMSWSTVMKRTFEAYIRGDRPNMYGEWLSWD